MRRTAASEDDFSSRPGSLPSEEKPDVMYQRISEFLHILGYQRGAPTTAVREKGCCPRGT